MKKAKTIFPSSSGEDKKVLTLGKEKGSVSPCRKHAPGSKDLAEAEEIIAAFIRKNDLARRESCLFCVKKHVGKALALYKELTAFFPCRKEKERCKGKSLLSHLEIIGNLQAAADEACQYKELYSLLLESERSYRYEGLAPDWEKIALLIHKNEGETI